MYGRISFAPSAQFTPTDSGRACATLVQKASTVCPESVRPERSVMVTLIITGTRIPRCAKISSIASSAAFALSVSKIVSTRRMSEPPSSRPRTCSA